MGVRDYVNVILHCVTILHLLLIVIFLSIFFDRNILFFHSVSLPIFPSHPVKK